MADDNKISLGIMAKLAADLTAENVRLQNRVDELLVSNNGYLDRARTARAEELTATIRYVRRHVGESSPDLIRGLEERRHRHE